MSDLKSFLIEHLIADVCNADKRATKPDIKELAGIVSVKKIDNWYKKIVRKDN